MIMLELQLLQVLVSVMVTLTTICPSQWVLDIFAAIDIVQFAPGDTRQYMTNEINQVYDGSRTRFRVTLDGVKDNTYTGHEDLIVSKNNVVLEPDVDYHLTDVGGHATR